MFRFAQHDRSMKLIFAVVIAFATSVCVLLGEQPESPSSATVFESGETQNSLIELFTSEGCSSCPPAEKWLSALKSNQDLWKKTVPVASHVDYWDHLGWRDAGTTNVMKHCRL